MYNKGLERIHKEIMPDFNTMENIVRVMSTGTKDKRSTTVRHMISICISVQPYASIYQFMCHKKCHIIIFFLKVVDCNVAILQNKNNKNNGFNAIVEHPHHINKL